MSSEVIEFDTDDLARDERFATWAQAMLHYQVATPDHKRFTAKIRAWRIDPVIVVAARMSAVRCVRSVEAIRTDGRDEILVQLLDGAHLVANADGRPVLAGSGDIFVQDRARPLEVALSAGRNVTLSLPRDFLDERLLDADVHGLVLRAGDATLLQSWIAAIPGALASPGLAQGALATLLRDLVAASLRAAGSRRGVSVSPDALRQMAKRHILQNLAGALDIPALCEALRVSRSRLYRAFEAEGGVARYVQAQRLARIHRLLSDPGERRSVSHLAACHGFPDGAHFSRLFRRTFGYSAQSLRRRSQQPRAERPAPVGSLNAAQVFTGWEAMRQ